MGIDVYLSWKSKTEEEGQSQITGFDINAGSVGYLREAYHGSPYATQILVPEAFDEAEKAHKPDGPSISAQKMRDRLPEVIASAIERGRLVYKEKLTEASPEVQSFVQFVELAERKEEETGEPCTVYASY